MVVDDNQTNRHILEAHLSRWGATVQCAASSSEALALLGEGSQSPGKVHLAVLDTHMPDIDGIDLQKPSERTSECAKMVLVALQFRWTTRRRAPRLSRIV